MANKKILLISIFATIALVAGGCTICSTCNYTYYSYGVESVYEEEYCGSRYEVKNFESEFKDGAEQENTVANCDRH